MNKRSGSFLAAAVAAMLVVLTRVVPAISVGQRVADFSAGLAAAFMVGALVTWGRSRPR
jgi:hypothetical protein